MTPSKICFVTGGNSGIGKATCVQLAQLGYIVLVGSRNQSKGTKATDNIKQLSGSNQVYPIQIDLSSKKSILNASQKIAQEYPKLDVLIHNAADFDISQTEAKQSVDGIETIWASNHIGPVLLTEQLMELLKLSPQARIITIASKGLMLYPNLKINLTDPEFKTRKFSVPKAYYQSKLAQVMYTYWLAKQLDQHITVNCIRVSNVKIDLERYPNLSNWYRFLYRIKSRFAISPEQMAQTYVYLAHSELLNHVTGKYFDENRNLVSSSAYSQNQKNIDDLMALTSQYLTCSTFA